MNDKTEEKVTLGDIMHEYLGSPRSLAEASKRMVERLTPKERKLLEQLQAQRKKP
jgi:hypothetical protein